MVNADMKKLLLWAASLFKVDVVWLEMGHGRWVKRRRYHPVMKAIVFSCVLALAVFWGRDFLSKPKVPEIKAQNEVLQRPEAKMPEVKISQFKMTDFHKETIDDHPGPIPPDLEVADDEYWLRIDKSRYTLYLYLGRNVEKTYEVAVGRNPGDKEYVGDNRTPVGTFTVQSIEDSRAWTYDFRDGKGPIRGAYGPWFIRLRTRWKGIGIHGTHDPDSLGSMASEGCIRMHNSELEELKQFASSNMKVVIEE